MKEVNILFFGQTPPPLHGQSIMIKKILDHKFEDVKICHVPMRFSNELSDIGRFSFSKILELLNVLLKGVRFLLTCHISAIYYPPAGHSKTPVLRDVVILLLLRLFRKKLIFHFHALGLKQFYTESGSFMKLLMQMAYGRPYCSVCISSRNIPDIEFLKAEKIEIIPYGIEDNYGNYSSHENMVPRILYLGNLYESKGVTCLMDAITILNERKIHFIVDFVGGYKDKKYQDIIESHDSFVATNVHFHGIKKGDEKWKMLSQSDMFCFPTQYENENFPVVILEAMSFGLPVISTAWRSVPDMVRINQNGITLESQDSNLLANAIIDILSDTKKRHQYGAKSREIYLNEYQEGIYLKKFNKLFLSI